MTHNLGFRRSRNKHMQFLTHPIGAGRLTFSIIVSSQCKCPSSVKIMHTHPRGMCTREKTSYDELRNVGGVRGVHSRILILRECGTRSAALPTTPETPKVWCDRPTLLPINNPITTSSQRSFNAFHPHRNVSCTPKLTICRNVTIDEARSQL